MTTNHPTTNHPISRQTSTMTGAASTPPAVEPKRRDSKARRAFSPAEREQFEASRRAEVAALFVQITDAVVGAAPMHSRTLLPFEENLLAGIAGEFRNTLTLWWSAKAEDMTWYPVVESVVDSLGNTITSGGNFVGGVATNG